MTLNRKYMMNFTLGVFAVVIISTFVCASNHSILGEEASETRPHVSAFPAPPYDE
jgi:hypothetical protein